MTAISKISVSGTKHARERLGKIAAMQRFAQHLIHSDFGRAGRELRASVAAHQDDRNCGPPIITRCITQHTVRICDTCNAILEPAPRAVMSGGYGFITVETSGSLGIADDISQVPHAISVHSPSARNLHLFAAKNWGKFAICHRNFRSQRKEYGNEV